MTTTKQPSVALVILAFAAVYIIWGSTYFFIEMAVKHIQPMVLGAVRFIIAGIIMMIWVAIKGESIWQKSAIAPAAISGLLMLFWAMVR
ncbi:EamA family transporter [Niabella hibiscisoli]|uniref:EamA family transporter n=1 Tax=Niabella hibiscisoli TaxID=1825928 RepID=UPI001F0F057E|nr:EamA family transporter [Niabella hibiscisoli]MCH5717519.1 EamA family transporter [Niabella hibiscisoli]